MTNFIYDIANACMHCSYESSLTNQVVLSLSKLNESLDSYIRSHVLGRKILLAFLRSVTRIGAYNSKDLC